MKTLHDILTATVRKYPDKTAFLIKQNDESVKEISYRVFLNHVALVGDFLKTSGQRYALFFENSYEWILVHAAVLCSANTAVHLDTLAPAKNLAELVRRAGACAVFIPIYTPAARRNCRNCCRTYGLSTLTERIFKTP